MAVREQLFSLTHFDFHVVMICLSNVRVYTNVYPLHMNYQTVNLNSFEVGEDFTFQDPASKVLKIFPENRGGIS